MTTALGPSAKGDCGGSLIFSGHLQGSASKSSNWPTHRSGSWFRQSWHHRIHRPTVPDNPWIRPEVGFAQEGGTLPLRFQDSETRRRNQARKPYRSGRSRFRFACDSCPPPGQWRLLCHQAFVFEPARACSSPSGFSTTMIRRRLRVKLTSAKIEL